MRADIWGIVIKFDEKLGKRLYKSNLNEIDQIYQIKFEINLYDWLVKFEVKF